MGDSGRGNLYASTARGVHTSLTVHWTGNFLQESFNRQQDAAVILALNEAYVEGDYPFDPTSLYAAATVKTLNAAYCDAYSINTADTNAGIAGVLYGRYIGDTYQGGNPRAAVTAALASLFYRGAKQAKISQTVPSDAAMSHWKVVFGQEWSGSADEFADMLAFCGDGVLERIR